MAEKHTALIDIHPEINPAVFERFDRIDTDRSTEKKNPVHVLQASKLVKQYGDHVVVPGIDFIVEDIADKNEIISLIGPSGCGKSTLLKMIAGLEPPTSGELKCHGVPVDGPGMDRGMIFQKYSSFPFLTVFGNIMYPLVHVKKMKKSEAAEKSEFWLKKMYLWDARDKYPHQLSGGMQQRVAIARTLSMDAKVILMDEPFGALDRKIRWEMQDLIAEIAFMKPARSFTILLVTHDIPEAVYLGDRVWIIDKGTISAEIPVPRPAESARKRQGRGDFVDMVNFFNEKIERIDLRGKS